MNECIDHQLFIDRELVMNIIHKDVFRHVDRGISSQVVHQETRAVMMPNLAQLTTPRFHNDSQRRRQSWQHDNSRPLAQLHPS